MAARLSRGARSAAVVLAGTASLAAAQVTFVNVAGDLAIDHSSHGRGAAMADLDGDGLPEIIAADTGARNVIYRQLADHSFVDVSSDWGLVADDRATWNVLAADFDEDGDNDLYFPCGGWDGAEANQMLRNDLSTLGRFSDVSDRTGDASAVSQSFGSTALDYDRDGDLDLFIANQDDSPCSLLRNDGAMLFTNVSTAAGIIEPGNFMHCGTGDLDNDGWLEIGVGRYDGANLLYHNGGDGTFTERAEQFGVQTLQPSPNTLIFGTLFEDFDGDGWMDIYVPVYRTEPGLLSSFYRNNGDGTFIDVAASSGITSNLNMGHGTGDLDADGTPDLLIGTGNPAFLADDILYLIVPDGAGGWNGVDVSTSSGITAAGPTRLHGMAMGDYDEDGDVDVYGNNGGPQSTPTSAQENFLWQNQGNGNGWLAVRLEGTLSPRTPVGARSVARTTDGRDIHRYLSVGKGFGNTEHATQHFGLGSSPGVAELRITWPSGIEQLLLNPPMAVTLDVVETGIRLRGDTTGGALAALDLCGPKGHQADLFYALQPLQLALTPFEGLLQLLPPVFPLGSFLLDDEGLASTPLPIPSEPVLVGITFHLQALIRPPATFGGTLSNGVAVTIL